MSDTVYTTSPARDDAIRRRLLQAGYGVTPTGFVPKRLDVILDEMHNELSEGFGVNTRLNPHSYLNVLMTNIADKIAELWETAQECYDSMYPFSAEDISLDNAAQFGGITREEARPTYCPVHAECVDGTLIPKNTRIKSDTNPSVEFVLLNDTLVTRGAFNKARLRVVVRNNEVYSIAVDGQLFSYTSSPSASAAEILQGICSVIVSDVFTAEVTGERLILEVLDIQKPCALTLSGNLTTESVTAIVSFASAVSGEIGLPNGSITEIVTAVPGLISVININGCIAGRERESDVDMRKSYIRKIFARSSRMLDSIKSALLLNVQGIKSVEGYENDTPDYDVEGRPPHSIELVVDGGGDAEIAEQILKNKAGGIVPYGSVEVDVPGEEGELITVRFNRPAYVYAWFRVVITMSGTEPLPPNYVELVKAVIIEQVNMVDVGKKIIPQKFISGIHERVQGIEYLDITAFYSESPTDIPEEYTAKTVPVSSRQRAVTDENKIEVGLSE